MTLSGTLAHPLPGAPPEPLPDPSSRLRSFVAVTSRSAWPAGPVLAVLLMVIAQGVVVALAVLVLVLLPSGASESSLTPTPTPQSAPVAP